MNARRLSPDDWLRLGWRALATTAATGLAYTRLEADALLIKRSRPLSEHGSTWRRNWAAWLCRVHGLEVHFGGVLPERGHQFSGRDERGIGRMFVINHRGAHDVALAHLALDAALVARADIAEWPVLGRPARRAGTLFVRRESRHSGNAVVQAMTDALRAGQGVAVFAEGTTYAGDKVRPLKAGAFAAALRAGAQIVPVGIAYHDPFRTAFGEEPVLDHLIRVYRERKMPAAIAALEPWQPTDCSLDDARRIARTKMQEAVDLARSLL